MKFLADENVDQAIVHAIRAAGYSVASVAELDPGLADPDVLAASIRSGAILLTADKDFGELVVRGNQDTPGVVLFRLAGLSSEGKAARIVAAIRDHGHLFHGAFAVLTRDSLRVRRPPPTSPSAD